MPFVLTFVVAAVLVAGPLASLTFGSHSVSLSGPLHPMVGETATYTASGTDAAPDQPDHYRFTYDGFDPFPEQDTASNTYTQTFGTAGHATVVVQYYDGEAGFQQPTSVRGAVTNRHHRREVHIAYSVPPGAQLSLVERGKGAQRTIAKRVRGRACPGDSSGPGGQKMLCARVRFKPQFGPGGKRKILAVVTEHGMPSDVLPVASYKAPKPKLPKRPGRLRLFRQNSTVLAAFRPPSGSEKTIAYARLSDGRRLSFDLAHRCTAVRIRGVRRTVSVTVQAYGLRQDMEGGRVATVTLKSKRVRAGGKGNVPRRVCR